MTDIESRMRASLDEFGRRIEPGPPPRHGVEAGAGDDVVVGAVVDAAATHATSTMRRRVVALAAAVALVGSIGGLVVLRDRGATTSQPTLWPLVSIVPTVTIGGSVFDDSAQGGPAVPLTPRRTFSPEQPPAYVQSGPNEDAAPPHTVWRLDPVPVSEALVRQFATALGFGPGSVVAESGPGSWSVTLPDAAPGTARALSVSQYELSNWTLSAGGMRPGLRDAAIDADAVPLSADEARRRTETMLVAMGFDPDAYTVDAVSMPWGAYALAWLTIDGVRSTFSMTFAFDGTGLVTWAQGLLVRPVAVGNYDLVDSATAASRLSLQWPTATGVGVAYDIDPGFSMLGSTYGATVGDSQRFKARPNDWFGSACAAAAAPETTSPDQTVDCPTAPPVSLTADGVGFGVVYTPSVEMLLVPSYRFVDEQGGMYMAIALAPEAVDFTDPSNQP